MRGHVGEMTVAQHSELTNHEAHIWGSMMYDIVFTKDRKEGVERKLVEISVVFFVRSQKIGIDEWFVNMGFNNELKEGFEEKCTVNLIRFKEQ